MVFILKHL